MMLRNRRSTRLVKTFRQVCAIDHRRSNLPRALTVVRFLRTVSARHPPYQTRAQKIDLSVFVRESDDFITMSAIPLAKLFASTQYGANEGFPLRLRLATQPGRDDQAGSTAGPMREDRCAPSF